MNHGQRGRPRHPASSRRPHPSFSSAAHRPALALLLAAAAPLRAQAPALHAPPRQGVSAPDTVRAIYINGFGAPAAAIFSIPGLTRAIDDIALNRGPGAGPGPGTTGAPRLLTRASAAIISTPSVNPAAGLEIVLTWYNTFTPGTLPGVPVATDPAGSVRIALIPPAGGWQPSTIYSIDLNLASLPGGGIMTGSESGGLELALYADPGPTPSPDFNLAWYGGGVSLGGSTSTYWSDANADGTIAQDEDAIFGGLESPRGNLVLSLMSDVVSGACCLPDGSCIPASAASCARALGVYSGDGSACGVCPSPGACILPSGACILTTAPQCSSLSGVYKGDATTCAESVCRSGPGQIALWNNGPLATGTLIGTAAAPAGTQWSEAAGSIPCFSPIAGYAGGISGPFRLADDFTIPAGETWTITSIDFFAFQTGASPATSPITATAAAIWNGPPYDPSSSIIGGNPTANIQTASTFANLYRCFSATPSTARPIFRTTAAFAPAVVLGPGHYWIDWQTTASGTGLHFVPPVTTKAFRGTPARNALQQFPTLTGPTWTHLEETGNPTFCGTGLEGVDFPFIIKGTTLGSHCPYCYANCDGSTTQPVLNVNDFVCFQTRYLSGDSYANCDGSSISPILNINDFLCFQSKYAQGCP